MTDIKNDFAVEHVERTEIQDATQGIRYVEGSEEEKRLLRKMDYRLIPAVWIMYVMSYLDRANIGNAKTGGMEKDLHLTSTQYSIALLVFFIGYVLGEVPSNMVLSRVRPSIYLPIIMAIWGGISMCMAACNSYISLSIVRLILGFVEAGFSPGVLFLLSCWYRKDELARRWALFYTGSSISGALGGILAGAITGHLDGKGGIEGWRYLFIIEGAATILTAVGALFLLPDYPSNTKWLTPEERMLAVLRLQADGVGVAQSGEEKGHWDSFKDATSDWRTWVMTFMYMMNTGAQTIQYFIPTLSHIMGYKGTTAQYMTVPIYMVATVGIVVVSFSSDLKKERPWHITGCMAVSIVSFAVLIGVTQHQVQYTFLCFGVGGIYACAPLILVWTSNIISWPAEKRGVSQAIVNALGNGASIYGSFLWPSNTAPRYYLGFGTTLAMMFAVVMAAQGMKFFNRRYPYPQPDNMVEDDEDTYDRPTDIPMQSKHVETGSTEDSKGI